MKRLKYLLVIFSLLLVFSCGPARRLPTVAERDSVIVHRVDSVFLTDTLVKWYPKDSTSTSSVPDTDTSHIETDLAISEAFVKDGVLHHSISNKSNLPVLLPILMPNRVISESRTHLQFRTVYQEVNKITAGQGFLITLGKVFLVVVGCLLLLVFLRNFHIFAKK